MEKIILNRSVCVGCGACVSLCDEHFEFGSDGFAQVKKQLEGVPSDQVMEAVEACPTEAIKIENE